MNEDERAIRNLVDSWLAATRAGDLATLSSLIADDAVFMVCGEKPFGKAAFMAEMDNLKPAHFEATSNIEELQILGDWAFLRNCLDVTMTLPGNTQSARRAGYTLTILRKEPDGKWRLARDANLMVTKPQA
ncbi:SgcJ/EcaC family oxidoreductase [Paraburkholderia sp. SARCC-3016]|uniref:SgcJ/EcaC family oxidoreductase n=1 Tax=Paraburkholderia sp. SARCC-3016 TaxID=3058611 RepID=UPI00280869FF|nr:SgcJ/EcaC family oxidoreductase [Paraburkholderia sp. SARCC-3016]MDQ7977797.1 SgcJ/EcaC family oxidoreductase [Paraburkholderia sp. SARCC-3016]